MKLTKSEFELLTDIGYSVKVIELYMGRVNVGVIENPDANLAYTGPCGDTIQLHLKISNNTIIEDAKFQYIGCPAAASSGSALTRIVKGKTLEEAKKITDQDILHELKGLPEVKLHCPKLAVTTLKKTIRKYENGRERSSYLE